jgi:uncharacterized surface protein with fasciclin (FAS1) repeats
MKKIKLTLVFCMLTISNLIFASIVHVPNVNATVAYFTGGGFPTPITLTVDATDIEFTYTSFEGIKAQNWNSITGNIFTVTPAGTYSDGLKLYQFNDPIDGSNFLNFDGATAYGPSPIAAGQEPAGIHYVGVKTDNNSYAWIMIDVVPGVELIIMGYAFEDNGGPIDAGDIGIAPPNSVYDIVSNSIDHTTLKSAIDACSLDGTLSGVGPFTLFAPTDAAFNLLPSGTVTALLADIPQLTDILLHHVVGDSVLSTMLSNNLVVPTLNGNVLVSITSGGVFIESGNGTIAQVTGADILADNGIVHVIDAVLLPAPPNSIYDIVSNSTDHTTLKSAIDACSLDGTLSGVGPFTLFAPTDAAFNLLPAGTVTALLGDIPQLTDILLHHVVGDSVLSTMLSNNLVVPTLNGDVLITINSMSEVFIDNAQVIVADLVADNGVVHVIDAVLLPTTTSVCELNHLDKVYSYSINILGEKINRNLRNQIIFDVYIDGSITKRYVR